LYTTAVPRPPGVLGVIAGVNLVAGYLPARRGTDGDCVELLRQE
jgi:ABC-type lipoprotein release transport system permease subunit